MTSGNFSFAKYAPDFDRHITQSIRGYDQLREDCMRFSQYFIQPKTGVLDIGCSTGELLRAVRDYNDPLISNVSYVGIDTEKNFADHWEKRACANLGFKNATAQKYNGFKNLSLVYSMFTLQFLPEKDRLMIAKKIYKALVPGGAFILSEKILAKNAKFQDMLHMTYYDHKRKAFSEKEILEKEASIRNQMHLWSEFKLFEMLRSAGFVSSYTQLFWRNHLFVGIIAMKPARYR
jgi:tRNA (cmo5U34)-methyltransferase